MASKTDNVLRVLLVEDSSDDAEQIVSILRNAAIAVRPVRAETLEQLDDVLAHQPLDLALVSAQGGALRLNDVIDVIQQSGKDLPVIALTVQPQFDQAVDLLRGGARDVAWRGSPEHIQIVCKREMEDARSRRALRRLEVNLKEAEKRAHSLLDSSRDPIAYVHDGMHVYANRAYLELFGYESFDDLEGMPILDMIASGSAGSFKELLKKLAKGESPPERLETKAQRPDSGEEFDAVMEFSGASIQGEPCTQIVFRQQVADAELVRQLEGLKTQDLATGLLNRGTFMESLESATSEAVRGQGERMLMLLEIDRFKDIVFRVGVDVADLLLGEAAQVLREKLKPDYPAGRIADSTLAVLARDLSLKDAEQLGQSVRKRFEDHLFEAGSANLNLTATIGLVTIGERSSDAAEAMNLAAQALAVARDKGGNCVHVFDPRAKDREAEMRYAEWVARIKAALTNNGFVLFYQPIVSMQGATSEQYDVLLRMASDKGEILPAEFMPAAERAGLLAHIDRWVIEHAVAVIGERAKLGRQTTLFIKITPATLADNAFAPWLLSKLKAARVPGRALVFEMPEAKAVTHLKQARAFLSQLQPLNCGFALEQFGSGLNSFQLLKHLPCTYVKIDRSFMVDLPKSAENQAKVKEIHQHAKAAGKQTIAEFIEDAMTMSTLWTTGIEWVQGNFLHPPDRALNYDFSGG